MLLGGLVSFAKWLAKVIVFCRTRAESGFGKSLIISVGNRCYQEYHLIFAEKL